jgi:hypothetical protein
LILPDQIVETIALNDCYFDLKSLHVYSGLGVSTLRYHIGENELPAFKIPGKGGKTGKILVKRSEFDAWLEQFRENDFVDIESIADEVVKGVI